MWSLARLRQTIYFIKLYDRMHVALLGQLANESHLSAAYSWRATKHPVIRYKCGYFIVGFFYLARAWQGSDQDQAANSYPPPPRIPSQVTCSNGFGHDDAWIHPPKMFTTTQTCPPPSSAVGFLLRIAFPFTKIICNPFYGSLNVESWRRIHWKIGERLVQSEGEWPTSRIPSHWRLRNDSEYDTQ